jgi:hypothetical protein
MALTVKHLFPFLKLMKALQIKDEMKNIMSNRVDVSGLSDEEKETVMQDKGIELMFGLIEKMPNAEKEIKTFLSIYAEKSLDDIEALPVEAFIELVKQLFREPAFKSFFTQAAK